MSRRLLDTGSNSYLSQVYKKHKTNFTQIVKHYRIKWNSSMLRFDEYGFYHLVNFRMH